MHTTSKAKSNHEASHPKHALRLFLDFDGTITENDTLHLVADVGYGVQARGKTSSHLPPWQEIVNAYLADYNAFSETYKPIKTQRSLISQENEWLHSLKPIEEASAQRAAEAGIFNNVQWSDVTDAARQALRSGKVRVRKGYGELMSYIDSRNSRQSHLPRHPIPLTILSVNWSTSFVHTIATEVSIVTTDDSDPLSLPTWTETLQVYANELPSIKATNPAQRSAHLNNIRTSGDKIQQFHHLYSSSPDSNARTIYVGDSTTDLECLLFAHTGICMRDKRMGSSQQELADACERLEIKVEHIHHKQDLEKSASDLLWWAHDFAEIQRWLESLDGD